MDELLERDSELAAVEAEVAELARGSGGLLFVEGAAGIGKSSLLARAAASAAEAGATVLSARGGDLERSYAFGVVRQLLQRPVGADRALLSGPAEAATGALGLGAGHGTPEDRFAVYNGLFWICATLAERAPLALVVDDAHWSDEESLQWLTYLGRRLEDLPLLLAVGTRPDEPGAHQRLLDTLRALPSATVIAPEPLSGDAVDRLVRTRVGDAVEEFSRACRTATGGNPFYLHELLEEARRQSLAPTREGAADVARLSPRGIASAVLVRLGLAGEPAGAVARAASALAIGAHLHQLAALARCAPAEAAEAWDLLAGLGILRPEPPLDFVHPVVRTAVHEDMSRAARSELHTRAAQLLAADGAPPGDVAGHLLFAAPAGDAWVAETLRAAAREAIDAGAPSAARRLLLRAREEPPARELRLEVLEDLAETGVILGKAEALRELLDVIRASDDADQRARMVWSFLSLTSDRDHRREEHDFESVLQEVAAHVRASGASSDVALIVEALAGLPADAGVEAVAEHAAATYPAMPPASRARALFAAQCAHSRLAGGIGTADEVAALAEEALLTESAPDLDWLWSAIGALNNADRIDRADALVMSAIEHFRARGAELGYVWFSVQEAFVAIRRGDLRRAEATSRAALELSERWSEQVVWLGMTRANLAEVLAARGAVDEAETVLAGLDERCPEPLSWSARHELYARGIVRLASGDPARAADDLERVAAVMRADGAVNPAFWPWRKPLVLALVRTGRAEEARTLAAEDVELSRGFGPGSAIGRALIGAGRAAASDEERVALLADAVRELERTPCRYDEALAGVELGAAMRRAGRRVDAREQLRRGLDLAAACGAEPLAAIARDELRASGARLRRERTSGIDALTPAEQRVAELAAQGQTNREIAQSLFLSLKTVEMHLGRVYRKLDISSRAGLPAALAADVHEGRVGVPVGAVDDG